MSYASDFAREAADHSSLRPHRNVAYGKRTTIAAGEGRGKIYPWRLRKSKTVRERENGGNCHEFSARARETAFNSFDWGRGNVFVGAVRWKGPLVVVGSPDLTTLADRRPPRRSGARQRLRRPAVGGGVMARRHDTTETE